MHSLYLCEFLFERTRTQQRETFLKLENEGLNFGHAALFWHNRVLSSIAHTEEGNTKPSIWIKSSQVFHFTFSTLTQLTQLLSHLLSLSWRLLAVEFTTEIREFSVRILFSDCGFKVISSNSGYHSNPQSHWGFAIRFSLFPTVFSGTEFS